MTTSSPASQIRGTLVVTTGTGLYDR